MDPLKAMKLSAERMYAKALATGEKRRALIFKHAAETLINDKNPEFFRAIGKMKVLPPTIEEFVLSKEFLGELMEVWPSVFKDLVKVNPDLMMGRPPVHEVFLGGATGTGKTIVGQVTTLYHAIFLTCFDRVQELFKLSRVTPILFLLQSPQDRTTKRVIYQPLRQLFELMPFAQKWCDFDKYSENSLKIAGNIEIAPALATVQAMVGAAIIGSIMDEVNFMSVVERSKQVHTADGQGGYFDQADVAYTTIKQRRTSRFVTKGVAPGVLCISSSVAYTNDFLDRQIQFVKKHNPKNTLVFEHKQYEMQPQDRYASGEFFKVLLGNERWPTRILADTAEPGKDYPADGEIERVPVELKDNFLRNPDRALRDIIGRASDAINPFFTQKHKIIEATLKWKKSGRKQIVTKYVTDLAVDGFPQIIEENLPDDRESPRIIHVDLAISQDRCGISMIKMGAPQIVVGVGGVQELLPTYIQEFGIGIQPSGQHKIDPADVRNWIMQLHEHHGFNIKYVSYDGFQSTESLQMFRKAGVRAFEVSVDRTIEPYEVLRAAIYDGRAELCPNELQTHELNTLEEDKKKEIVDHRPSGSKDISDSLCGAVFLASRMPALTSGTRFANVSGPGRRKVTRRA